MGRAYTRALTSFAYVTDQQSENVLTEKRYRPASANAGNSAILGRFHFSIVRVDARATYNENAASLEPTLVASQPC